LTIEQINRLPSLAGLEHSSVLREADRARGAGAFGDIYNAYIGLVTETDTYQAAAEKAQVDYTLGKTDDMAAVLLAQEKAYASLNFTVQVTNKVLDAYREIMRIGM
jgi:flagellar hook-basal body complex protein FliE